MSCEHDCTRPPVFPRTLDNRPGLDRIDYRIGDYDSMREHMLALLDAAPALAAWTHRRADDPGIALVESAAMLADVLARYQDVYANEAYLRTATQRDAVAELVRLLGYRLAPGLGGRARFALAVKGPRPVPVPAGFAITVQLPSAPKPAVFETAGDLLARPALSKFHLYRPRHVPAIANGADTFQLDADDAIALAPGDRLLVGTASGQTLTHTQILVVDKVWEAFGIRHVKTRGRIASLLALDAGRLVGLMAGTPAGAGLAPATAGAAVAPLAVTTLLAPAAVKAVLPAPLLLPAPLPTGLVWPGAVASGGVLAAGLALLPAFSGLLNAGLGLAIRGSVPSLRAYKIGASARHFGHSAQATRIALNEATGRVTEVPVPYMRRLDATQGDPAGPQLRARQLPLDGEVADFSAGTTVLVELNLAASASGASARKRVLERAVTQIDRQSLAWGAMTGASTVLQLDADLAITEGGSTLRWADIRGISVHQVQGAAFTLRAAARATPLQRGKALDFFGLRDDAQALADRTLLLALPEGPLAVAVQDVALDRTGGPEAPRFHRLTLDHTLAYANFEHAQPAVDVYANLVDASEGRSEPEVPLGDGDARLAFQTFALPKAPLTYLRDTAVAPPHVPQLQVRVGGVLWQRVDGFFDRGPREPVYIVRETDDGKSVVQFGDGVNGARLPSGVRNVTAAYRSGSGAHGLPAGADKPSAAKRLPGFDALWMLEPATGAAAPESAANARLAAPASMQSLGRIVSLADLEAEALSLAGVLKARAAWQLLDGAPLVALTVLVAGGEAADAAAVEQALRRALAARGPARWPLVVKRGRQRRIRIGLTVAADPALREQDLGDAIAAALGVEDDDPADDLDLGARGLMHWRQRTFGDGVHGSQVVAAVQNVAGVRWVQLDRLQLEPIVDRSGVGLPKPLGGGLASLGLPLAPSRRQLRATATQLLSLARSGLSLQFAAATTGSRP